MNITASKYRKKSTIYRMVIDQHTCPYGLKAKYLLKTAGYQVEDRPLLSRESVEAFKAEHDVKTTPQIFVEGERIGGYEDLRRYLGKSVSDPKALSYKPVFALFAMTALMAMAASYAVNGNAISVQAVQWFIAFSMATLALMKLQNLESFSSMFLNYDLLAKRWLPYSYLYPFLEGSAALLMIAGTASWISVPISLIIGSIGAISVFKAVYMDRRELKCACVGGSSNVPLGFVSLTENLLMIAMGIWMALSSLGLTYHS